MPPRQGRKIPEEARDTPIYKYPAYIPGLCGNRDMGQQKSGFWKFAVTGEGLLTRHENLTIMDKAKSDGLASRQLSGKTAGNKRFIQKICPI